MNLINYKPYFIQKTKIRSNLPPHDIIIMYCVHRLKMYDAMTPISIGMQIREARKVRGWTQSYLAIKADTCIRTISRAESGNNVDLETLCRIATALAMDIRLTDKSSDYIRLDVRKKVTACAESILEEMRRL